MRHFYYLCFLLLGFLSLPVRAGGDNRAPEQYTKEYIYEGLYERSCSDLAIIG